MDASNFGQDLVWALLRDQHPDLADLELRDVNGGWDNQQWRLGDELAVRLPRTERAPALLRTEQTWLPLLAKRLPLPTRTGVGVGSGRRFASSGSHVCSVRSRAGARSVRGKRTASSSPRRHCWLSQPPLTSRSSRSARSGC